MVTMIPLWVKTLVQRMLVLPVAVYAYGDGSDKGNCSDCDSDDKAEITAWASASLYIKSNFEVFIIIVEDVNSSNMSRGEDYGFVATEILHFNSCQIHQHSICD